MGRWIKYSDDAIVLPSLADALLILVPSLVLAGGTVEEQIDETDIRKIPQIVCAESGSLTVPV
jgi:hypothetical protein